ncbi:Dimethylaniline monooxygenase [Forsythia ovata]|uniref:Dimethylaniline monooxygenase n=1 Tax=Forsythia ovata TaxID=205694 RepID=A0ABD1UAC5_9LAMI
MAVIGAGVAGLAAARELRREGQQVVVVYEKSDQLGRTWVYDPRVESDPLGPSSQQRNYSWGARGICFVEETSGSASKKCKSRRKISEDNNIFKEAVGAIDKATNRLAEVLLQCANQSSSKDNELLEHLVEIGVEDDDELLNAQTFLLENPTKMWVFYSFPVHRRKNVLMKMLQNATK